MNDWEYVISKDKSEEWVTLGTSASLISTISNYPWYRRGILNRARHYDFIQLKCLVLIM
jgi:hypothetical protein